MSLASDASPNQGIPLLGRPMSFHAEVPTINQGTIRRKPVPHRDVQPSKPVHRVAPNITHYSALPEDTQDDIIQSPKILHPILDPLGTPPSITTAAAPSEDRSWTPYVLRWQWLLLIICFGASLLFVLAVLHYISAEHGSLLKDDGSAIIFFGWRFAPTLLAVFYVTMLMIILDAVKRTEAFARLAGLDGASASATILRTPRPWWTTLADSFPRQSNGSHPAWTMLGAVLAYILGILVLSPFSSALLTSREVSLSQSMTFERAQLESNSTLEPSIDTLDYFRTFGHVLQNVTTSPWISDEYTVLPFWPSGTRRPSGSRFADSGEVWEAESIVIKSELACEELSLVSGPVELNYSYSYAVPSGTYTTFDPKQSLQFASESGCEYGLAYNNYLVGSKLGASFWSALSQVPIYDFLTTESEDVNTSEDYHLLLNHTSQCEPGEVIMAMIGSDLNGTYQTRGHICRPTFYEASLPITASINPDTTMVLFNEGLFHQLRRPIALETLNLTIFQDDFLNRTWNAYMTAADSTQRPVLGGPANLLAALYGFNLSDMMADPTMTSKASGLKQRILGQSLQTAIDNSSIVTSILGKVVTTERRITIVPAAAYTVEVTLSLTILLLVVTFFLSRANRRSLGLSQDPAFSNTVASLLSGQPETRMQLQEVSGLPETEMKKNLQSAVYKVVDGGLRTSRPTDHAATVVNGKDKPAITVSQAQWKPKILSTWAISSLLIVLTAILVTITVLYTYSHQHGLYQSAFVYQISIGGSGDSLGTLAPYSIFPTLLAVIIGLWWSALENIFRVAQPFISMAERPTASGRGAGLSYQSSYLAWAASRAVLRRHWLLAVVCTGAFLAQICKSFDTGMSAFAKITSDHCYVGSLATRAFQTRNRCRLIPTIPTARSSTCIRGLLVQDRTIQADYITKRVRQSHDKLDVWCCAAIIIEWFGTTMEQQRMELCSSGYSILLSRERTTCRQWDHEYCTDFC